MTALSCVGGDAVSRLGIGTVALGLARGDAAIAAQHAVSAALEQGLNLFDTAPLYGRGLAELRLGEVLAGAERDRLFVATKVGRPIPADRIGADQSFVPGFDFSFQSTLTQVAASLERLRLTRFDAIMIHDIGRRTHGERHPLVLAEALHGAYAALEQLRRQGVVRLIGIGANEAEIMLEACAVARFDILLVAGRYTLLEHGPSMLEVLRRAQDARRAIVLGGVYNSGILASGSSGGRFDYRAAPNKVLERVAKLEASCARFGVTLPAAALQFALGGPGVSAVLIGPANEAELRASLAFARQVIDAGLWESLRSDCDLPADSARGVAWSPRPAGSASPRRFA